MGVQSSAATEHELVLEGCAAEGSRDENDGFGASSPSGEWQGYEERGQSSRAEAEN
jgi:hypothetical protein